MPQSKETKIFVLDTNILLADPFAFKKMGEHDVVIPLTVICELDKIKSMHDSIAVNARQVSANLDAYFGPELYKGGVSLGDGRGKLSIINVKELHPEVKRSLRDDIPDHRIISAALKVKERVEKEANGKNQKKKVMPPTIVLISNDNNMRLKAGSFGLAAEKYRNVSVTDMDSIYSGVQNITLSSELTAELQQYGALPYEKVRECLGVQAPEPHINEFFIIRNKSEETDESEETVDNEDPSKNIYASFCEDSLILIREVSTKVYGQVNTRNAEQMLGMKALLDPKISLVTLSGSAGTGKTLMAIGAAFRQLSQFDQILISKPIVPLSGYDNGALPGDAIEKVLPYMNSLYDNINFLKSHGRKVDTDKIEQAIKAKKIMVEPLAYIRGRTYPEKTLFILDEAQNLTPHDIKTLITRMGDNSKIIFTGDVYQIDNPHLDASNNGFSVLIERSKDLDRAAHINLVKGERSTLAEWGSKNL